MNAVDTASRLSISEAELDQVFAALANPIRRGILTLAVAEQANVTVLAERFGVSLPAITRHLNVLRDAGLVALKRQGRDRRIQVEVDKLQIVAQWVEFYSEFWRTRFASIEDFLDKQADHEASG